MSDNRRGRGGSRGRGGGGGRHNDSQQGPSKPRVELQPAIADMFTAFQTELDSKYDRYERLVKHSRDITIESKRAIFLLHRFTQKTSESDQQTLLKEVEDKLEQIRQAHWKQVALELRGQPHNQYIRAYTNGMQENLEAYSFLYFLTQRRLITIQEYQAMLMFQDADTPDKRLVVHVPLLEYMLGIGDLGGELMRMALNYIALAQTEYPVQIRQFLRDMYAGYCLIGNTLGHKDVGFKVHVLRQSLMKVESALYTLRVRATEVPPDMLAKMVQAEPWLDDNAQYDNSFD